MVEKSFRKNPGWFRAVNSIWRESYFLGTKIKLEADDLLKAAKNRTGLTDPGKDFFDEPLKRLLTSIEQEANLHPIGRFIARERFISLLAIRLRAEYYFRKYPAILEQEIYPAWIIIGLQRTGTTKLQRLLAVDPDHRVIPSWEVINPVPLDLNYFENQQQKGKNRVFNTKDQESGIHSSPTFNPDRYSKLIYPDPGRIRIANASVKAVKFMSPGFFAIHPIDTMQPEEDILLLDVSFLSTTPEAMMHVPSYASWLESADQSSAYDYASKLLKLLQWVKPARRWILKTPHHLEFPHLIDKYFGPVRFIWPHRKIYESVPSFLSMVTYNRMIFSSDVDEKQVADHWVRKTGYMLEKALQYRFSGNNDQKFLDLRYDDLITDPMGQLANIYNMNGGISPEMTEAFQIHERENQTRKHGKHLYSLRDFGLTKADIDKHTSHYQQFISKKFDRG